MGTEGQKRIIFSNLRTPAGERKTVAVKAATFGPGGLPVLCVCNSHHRDASCKTQGTY